MSKDVTDVTDITEVNEIFCVVSLDNNIEDVFGKTFKTPEGSMAFPFVCVDRETLEGLKDMARTHAKYSGEKLKVLRFSTREVVEVIDFNFSNLPDELMNDPVKREQFYNDH